MTGGAPFAPRDNDRVAILIPARYASSRLPGKPLALIDGKPMIQHVCERAAAWGGTDLIIVATDDDRVATAVAAFGGRAVMTSPDHPSGTDRVAEAAAHLEAGILINLQGDEPLLHPEMIAQLARAMREDPSLPMATLAHPLTDPSELADPNCVKVVCDRSGLALYFSRAAIPYWRDGQGRLPTQGVLRHLGLYAFRADFLQTFARLPPTFLEQTERLEQLRALEHGYRIRVVITAHQAMGVDTPEDLERIRQRIEPVAKPRHRASGEAPGEKKAQHIQHM